MDLSAKIFAVVSSNCFMSVLYGIMPAEVVYLSKRVVLTWEQTTTLSQDTASVPGLARSPVTLVFYVALMHSVNVPSLCI